MEFFKKQTNIGFMRIRLWTALLSTLLFVGSLGSLAVRGINWGLDFTGGTVIELTSKTPANLDNLRTHLQQAGFKDAVVQSYGTSQDVLVRLAPRANEKAEEVAQRVKTVLETASPGVTLMRVDAVGSQVGEELAQKGAMAVVVALLLTMLYIMFRFELRFAIGAAVALAHDPILIMGIFSLFQIEFDLPTLAAVLAVIGYSLNDTIVVFDRVKENFIKIRKATPIEVMDISINQTLSRTIMTSLLTLLVVLALLIYGGPTIHGFSLALVIGIVIGTYSSIYVAGALAVALGLSKKDLMPELRSPVDDRP